MAVFPVSPGHPDRSGVWLPSIWSAKLNVKYYETSVVPAVANTNFEGEAKKGEKVIIRQIPTAVVRDYTKGQTLVYDDLESSNVELLIDKGKVWTFKLDDVEAAQTDIDWINEVTDDGAKQLAKAVDTDVLGTIYASAHASNKGLTAGVSSSGYNLGVTGTPVALDKTNIIEYITALAGVLDEQDAYTDGGALIIPPLFAWLIKNSDISDASYTGDKQSVLRNGRIGMIDKFEIYTSKNLATASDGGKTCYNCLALNKDALTFAAQVDKTEKLRLQETFGDAVRALMVYGYKVVKPEGLAVLYAYKA